MPGQEDPRGWAQGSGRPRGWAQGSGRPLGRLPQASTGGGGEAAAWVRDASHLQCNYHIVIRVAHVAEQPLLVRGALREVDRPRARRGVLAAGDALLRLRSSVDVRDQDPVGAAVKRLLDASPVLVPSHTHHRLGLAGVDGQDHVRQPGARAGEGLIRGPLVKEGSAGMSEQTAAGKALRLWVHRTVLRVNQKPVVPRAAQLLSDGGRATVEEEAHLRLTSLQLGLEDLTTLIGDRHSVLCRRAIDRVVSRRMQMFAWNQHFSSTPCVQRCPSHNTRDKWHMRDSSSHPIYSSRRGACVRVDPRSEGLLRVGVSDDHNALAAPPSPLSDADTPVCWPAARCIFGRLALSRAFFGRAVLRSRSLGPRLSPLAARCRCARLVLCIRTVA